MGQQAGEAMSTGTAAKPAATSPPAYTEFHPRWYRPPISTYWWLGKWAYVKFILRELSSVAVAWTVAITLYQIRSLARGADAYARFEHRMSSPLMIAINLIAFSFLMFHAITWFNLAPKAMPVRIQGKRLPDILIAGPQYFAWIVISGIVFAIVLSRT
jgi:fumarate reductase subunit C